MKNALFSVIALPALMLAMVGCAHPRLVVYSPPPPEMSQVMNQGFHDGVHAAQHDLSRGMAPNVDRHPRFRNPPVPYGPAAEDYRTGFRRGYRMTYHRTEN